MFAAVAWQRSGTSKHDLHIGGVLSVFDAACSLQEEHEGEEVDFDQSYFFPEWKEKSEQVTEPTQSDFEAELRRAAAAA